MLPIDRLKGSNVEQKLLNQAEVYSDIYGLGVQEGIGIGLTRTNYSADPYYAYPDPKTNNLPYPRNDRYEPLPSHYAINRAILMTDRIA
jgi:hypothetical protein